MLSVKFVTCLVGPLLLACMGRAQLSRPPKMIVMPDETIYFKDGETVELPCRAEGEPSPLEYKWRRDDRDFEPSGNDDRWVQLPGEGTLVCNRPEAKDVAIYQCFARNQHGTALSLKINLQQGRLSKFPEADPETIKRALGTPVTLQCVPPVSLPTAEMTWILRDQSGSFSVIDYDSHITMDYFGELHITNLLTTDADPNKGYVCMAINEFMRKNSLSSPVFIEAQGQETTNTPVGNLWSSPVETKGIWGKVAKMKCIFSGNPTPRGEWRRDSGAIPPLRSNLESFGMELVIRDLRLEDEGEYECLANNDYATRPVSKTFRLSVMSTPEWLVKPEDIETSVGGRAVFMCKGVGKPRPDVDLTIDGKKLSDLTPNSRRIVNRGFTGNSTFINVTYVNLTKSDTQVIQCNISNPNGYIFTNAYLNILEDPPEFIRPPEPQVIVAEGQSVNLTCQTTGKPDPVITWFKQGRSITGGRYVTLLNGDLMILSVVLSDAGHYGCEAVNKYGRVSANGTLAVRRRTRIEQVPLDLEVIEGNDAKFTCSATTDTDEIKQLQILWRKDDKPITPDNQRMTSNYQDNSLTVTGTIARDSGRYTCVATNGLDNATASAMLTIKGRPDPSTDVTAIDCFQDRAVLEWSPGSNNNAPILNFIVQFNTTFTPDIWTSIRQIDKNQNIAEVSLTPWTNYTFRVLSRNKIGDSEPSEPTKKVCRTNPDVPFSNPANVRTIGEKKKYLIVEWTEMPQIQHNSQGFQYLMSYRRLGDTAANWLKKTVSDYKQTRLELKLDISEPYQPYEIKIRAHNSEGDAQAEAPVFIGYSGEEEPKVTPSGLDLVTAPEFEITSTTATLEWDPIHLNEENLRQMFGKFMGYRTKIAIPGRQGHQPVASTGHVNSPQTIFIGKRSAKTPKTLPRKGRKSVSKVVKQRSVRSRVGLEGVDANLEGLQRIMKTPKNKRGKGSLNATLTGFSELLMTPEDFYSGAKTPESLAYQGELSASPKLASPKGLFRTSTPRSAGRSTSLKVSSSKEMQLFKSPVDKIVSPPSDFKKVIALSPIHGKAATPKLPTRAKLAVRKTPKTHKMLWSDVVKKHIDPTVVTGLAQQATVKPSTVKTDSRKRMSTPKAQKTKIAIPGRQGHQPVASTGHVNSPQTIFIGKRSAKTPKTLPRKGRKSVSKVVKQRSVRSRVGLEGVDANLEGLQRIMKTPKNKRGKGSLNATLTGVSELLMTPEDFYSGAKTPESLAYQGELSASPKLASPKGLLRTSTPRSAGRRTTLKVSSSKEMQSFKSPVDKIVSPPSDFKKVIALSPIHGKAATPKLPTRAKLVVRKTPKTYKMLWSDVVKKHIDPTMVTGLAQQATVKPSTVKTDSRKRMSTPKAQKVVKQRGVRSRVGLEGVDASLEGLQRIMKTTKNKRGKGSLNATLTGVSELLLTPEDVYSGAKTPESLAYQGELFASPKLASPKGLFRTSTPRSAGRRTSLKVSSSKEMQSFESPVDKIVSPPSDFKKVIALSPIHGKAATPKLPTRAKLVVRKTPKTYKMLWSDVVKKHIDPTMVTGLAQQATVKPSTVKTDSRKRMSTPKAQKVVKQRGVCSRVGLEGVDASLEGLQRIMKTTKNKRGKGSLNATLTGVSELLMTPEDVYSGAKTPESLAYQGELFASPKLASPKGLFRTSTPRSAGRRTSLKVSSSKEMQSFESPVDKIVSPPSDFKKVIALSPIHGKAATPKLPTRAKLVVRKTPKTYKMLWSDVVKKHIDPTMVTGLAQQATVKPSTVKTDSRKRMSTPKAQKTKIAIPGRRGCQPVASTGHFNSPETIFIGKRSAKTPKTLPRKGRKSVSKVVNKTRKQKASPSLKGIKEMMATAKGRQAVLAGVKELLKTPNQKGGELNTSGMDSMFASPPSAQIPPASQKKSAVKQASTPATMASPAKKSAAQEAKSPKTPVQLKSTRSRRARGIANSPKVAPSPKAAPSQKQVKSPKPTRGKRKSPVESVAPEPAKKVKVQSPEPEKPQAEGSKTTSKGKASPVKKATVRRGRSKKVVQVTETEVSPVKTRGRKRSAPASSPVVVLKKVSKMETLPEVTSPKAVRSKASQKSVSQVTKKIPSPKKGRTTRGRKAAPRAVLKSPSPVKRRTRGKAAVEEPSKPSPVKRVAQAASKNKASNPLKVAKPKKVETPKKAATPKRATRGRKAAKKEEEDVEVKGQEEKPTPMKAGQKRRRKAPAEATPAKMPSPGPVKAAKGRKAVTVLKVTPKKAATRSTGKAKGTCTPGAAKSSPAITPVKRQTRAKATKGKPSAKKSPSKSPAGKPKRGKLIERATRGKKAAKKEEEDVEVRGQEEKPTPVKAGQKMGRKAPAEDTPAKLPSPGPVKATKGRKALTVLKVTPRKAATRTSKRKAKSIPGVVKSSPALTPVQRQTRAKATKGKPSAKK